MSPIDRYKDALLWVSRMQELNAEVSYSADDRIALKEMAARFFKEANEARARALTALNESILKEVP